MSAPTAPWEVSPPPSSWSIINRARIASPLSARGSRSNWTNSGGHLTNSISAGIYISHGHASIYGSDVRNWADYESLARDLPDLRLPVDSFEHFCLLLEKDPATINTVLDRKNVDEITLAPFTDSTTLTLRIFNDINVVFGPKGTGKSCILKAIAKHYLANGIEAHVHESGGEGLDALFDTKGDDLTINLIPHGVDYCSDEIARLRRATEAGVTSLSKYVAHFRAKSTNKNAKRLLLKDLDTEEPGPAKRQFGEFAQAATTTGDFLSFLADDPAVRTELSAEDHEVLTRILSGLFDRLNNRAWASFAGWKTISLLNTAIAAFRKQVERKTGTAAKPTDTGFREYALNRMMIELGATKIITAFETSIPVQTELVGSLGAEKGDLELRTEFTFQGGSTTDGELSSLTGVKKRTQKAFAKGVREILARAYADDLFTRIATLNEIEDIERIKTVYELVQFKKYFALEGQRYQPSSGEESMVMLQRELGSERDVYILDEPEKSLGNEYISEIIVPLIKERARAGRRIVISTHDANIAVRTLPYCSVYRCHGAGGYSTYVGNPFTNDLVNLEDGNDRRDWKKVSMKTLEGGEEAFGERGRIYGHG